MKQKVKKLSGKNGFTMIEIIAVLVIISIIAAIAISRLQGTSSYDFASQVEVVKNHLRYAQSRAMDSSSIWGINFISSTQYYLFQGSGSNTPILLPGEDNTTVNLITKKSQLNISSAPLRITFNGYGSPGADTITINTNGGSIIITKYTGFIP